VIETGITEEIAMRANVISVNSSRQVWIFIVAGLATVCAVLVWQSAGRMGSMRTQAANRAEFAQLKPQDGAKIVVEVAAASAGRFHGKLLEKRDETHYTRTGTHAEVAWSKDTALIMGKAEDIHAGAIVHVTGNVAQDHSVLAQQIVVLTGYVQVK
jgi:hypothetical protein